jgi:CheY-like chemotaxis protein
MQNAPNNQPSPNSEHLDYSLPLRILLVDDNLLNQRLTLRQLQILGYGADVVSDGQAAVEAVARSPYDVVLMDCQMPGLNGFDATAAIRQWEEHTAQRPPTIVIAMTASDLDQDRQRAIATGMNDYLTKPVRKEMLEALLGRWERIIRAKLPTNDTDKLPDVSEAAHTDLRSHLDFINLRHLSDGCPEFELELLQIFIEDSRHYLQLLQQAILQQDFVNIEQAAHHVKGASANIGASRIQHIAEAIEQRSRQQKNDFGDLVAQLTHSLNYIQSFLQTQH